MDNIICTEYILYIPRPAVRSCMECWNGTAFSTYVAWTADMYLYFIVHKVHGLHICNNKECMDCMACCPSS